jgi:hypothetical protein
MSLFPIIYTSLLIFSGLTVVVVLFSFISYKVRGEKQEPCNYRGATVNLSMTPAYQTYVPGSSSILNPVAQRNQIRTAYERKRAEVRLNYLNDVQRTKQRYVARSSSTTEETISNRQKNRFEVVTTFEREPDSQQSFSQETHGYNYNDNSLMNYYSNESDVYYRPAIRS